MTTGLGEELTGAFRAVARENPRLQGVIDVADLNVTAAGQRLVDDGRLASLIQVLSKHRLGLNDVEPDILDRGYEYLLRKLAEGQGQSAGEFLTPREVGVMMAIILDPQLGTSVCDPTSSSMNCSTSASRTTGGCFGRLSRLTWRRPGRFMAAATAEEARLGETGRMELLPGRLPGSGGAVAASGAGHGRAPGVRSTGAGRPEYLLVVRRQPRQGVAVIAGNGYWLESHPLDPSVTHSVFPVRVLGPVNFALLAVWALPRPTYVGAVDVGLTAYRDLLAGGPAVVTGDFRSHWRWDGRGRDKTHGMLVERLGREFGFVSAYHAARPDVDPGAEEPILHCQWNADWPFHIDYCFLPEVWVSLLGDVKVGTFEDWEERET